MKHVKPHSKKNRLLRAPLACLFIGLTVFTSNLLADPLYLRPEAGGGPIVADGTYTWDLTETNWYDSPSGGTPQTWTDGSVAWLWTGSDPENWGGSVTIEVGSDLTLGGVSTPQFEEPGLITLTSLDSLNPVTLTFNPESVLNTGGDNTDTRMVEFSSFNIVGDFTVGQGAVFSDIESFNGGTITVSDGSNLSFRGVTDARVVLDGGKLQTYGSHFTITHLSGVGTISRAYNIDPDKRTITLDQSENTVLVGRSANWNRHVSFEKAGTGAFVVNNTSENLSYYRTLTATEGTLLLNGENSVGRDIIIKDGAEFGGIGQIELYGDDEFELIMEAGGSILTAGFADVDGAGNLIREAGNLEIDLGESPFTALDGGTFNFYMDGTDGLGGLLNSGIQFLGTGNFEIGSGNLVNLFGLGEGLLVPGQVYTLISLSADLQKSVDWNDDWQVNQNTTGYDVGEFGWVGDELQVSFVPEVGTLALPIVAFGFVFFLRRRRDGCVRLG